MTDPLFNAQTSLPPVLKQFGLNRRHQQQDTSESK
jgi:hypothetical protein